MTSKKLYEMYVILGAPQVYFELLKYPAFLARMQKYVPGQKNLTRPGGLAQSLYYTKQWADQGWTTVRPDGIWARDERTFWKILKERKGNSQIIKLCFSAKLHPCPQCQQYSEIMQLNKCLQQLIEKADCKEHRDALER